MTTCFLAPDPLQSTFFLPGTATPGNGVLVFFYQAGTTTKQTAYKDNAAAASHTNPMVLDSGGNPPSSSDVWFAEGQTYKVVYAPANDTDPPASPYRTLDNLSGINDVSSSLVEWQQFSGAPTFVSATTFTLTGDQTAVFPKGQRVKTSNTGGTIYGTVTSNVFSGGLTTIVLLVDTGNLDSGLSTVYYSSLNAANISEPQTLIYAVPPSIRLSASPIGSSPQTFPDVVNTTAIYVIPYNGNQLQLWSGDGTLQYISHRISAAVSTAIPNATGVRDVFIYASSGVPSLTTLPWTNNTTRASSLAFYGYVPCLSGDPTKLYVGTYWATSVAGVGTIPDTASTRCIWSYWNQIPLSLVKIPSTNSVVVPQASSAAVMVWGADSSNSFQIVLGMQQQVDARVQTVCKQNNTTGASGQLFTGINLDAWQTFLTTSYVTGANVSYSRDFLAHGIASDTSCAVTVRGDYSGITPAGLHTLVWLTCFVSNSSVTYYGSSDIGGGLTGQAGMFGSYLG